MAKPTRKTKKYRPPQGTGERKHNILSNISICGETDISDSELTVKSKKQKVKRVKEEGGNFQTQMTPASMPNQSVVIEQNQMIAEDELTGLLLNGNCWDECQMELLDSLLDSL